MTTDALVLKYQGISIHTADNGAIHGLNDIIFYGLKLENSLILFGEMNDNTWIKKEQIDMWSFSSYMQIPENSLHYSKYICNFTQWNCANVW